MPVVHIRWKSVFTLAWALASLLFFCEFLIYYLVQIRCTWPQLSHKTVDRTLLPNEHRPLKVMLLADTHLLGPRSGHWFDKMRREWQMWRAFQTAMMLHEPALVVILGDVFDEGMWVSELGFANYLRRFYALFYHSNRTRMQVIVGNHDTGFHHYSTNRNLYYRFERAFGESVRLLDISGNLFVTVNSMAMEGDGCYMCSEAMHRLETISHTIECAKTSAWHSYSSTQCSQIRHVQYSKPVVLVHFPLYRYSDANCTGDDAAPSPDRFAPFKEQFHCMSRESTTRILSAIKPRLVFSAHTHHGCYVEHGDEKIPEHSVPSFSWRNRNNPSYMMLVIRNNNYAITKCYLPRESTVIWAYILGIITILCWQLVQLYRNPLGRSGYKSGE